ncbi:hypothetical protein J5U21_02026 [Saccharolobus shibatae]|uniref:Uncharacterized protein n=1 Tax=Saccharolobus shibatae TaxID=2286 RepID=A0A8F5BVV5_9CREN|nr:hypothetical protein J5U21_02026 [Saccharolobus shibatae]
MQLFKERERKVAVTEEHLRKFEMISIYWKIVVLNNSYEYLSQHLDQFQDK